MNIATTVRSTSATAVPFDPNHHVWADTAFRVGDHFTPNAESRCKFPFIPGTVRWIATADITGVEPDRFTWHERLERHAGLIFQFEADVTLQQNGGHLELRVDGTLNHLPYHAKRGYQILEATREKLTVADDATGRVCTTELTNVDPHAKTGTPFAGLDFDWVLPLGMKVVKHGSFSHTRA